MRPASHLFYAQEKAEIEALLRAEADDQPEIGLYLLRPPVVLGPHSVGAKQLLPGPLAPLGDRLGRRFGRLPVPLPALVPELPVQFIHEEDVGRAFVLCVVGAGPPGAYNITADGVLTAADVVRELGLVPLPLPVPRRVVQASARAVSALPLPSFVPPVTEWAEALSHRPSWTPARPSASSDGCRATRPARRCATRCGRGWPSRVDHRRRRRAAACAGSARPVRRRAARP